MDSDSEDERFVLRLKYRGVSKLVTFPSPCRYVVGDEVPVLYDPADPADMRVCEQLPGQPRVRDRALIVFQDQDLVPYVAATAGVLVIAFAMAAALLFA